MERAKNALATHSTVMFNVPAKVFKKVVVQEPLGCTDKKFFTFKQVDSLGFHRDGDDLYYINGTQRINMRHHEDEAEYKLTKMWTTGLLLAPIIAKTKHDRVNLLAIRY